MTEHHGDRTRRSGLRLVAIGGGMLVIAPIVLQASAAWVDSLGFRADFFALLPALVNSLLQAWLVPIATAFAGAGGVVLAIERLLPLPSADLLHSDVEHRTERGRALGGRLIVTGGLVLFAGTAIALLLVNILGFMATPVDGPISVGTAPDWAVSIASLLRGWSVPAGAAILGVGLAVHALAARLAAPLGVRETDDVAD